MTTPQEITEMQNLMVQMQQELQQLRMQAQQPQSPQQTFVQSAPSAKDVVAEFCRVGKLKTFAGRKTIRPTILVV